MSWSSKVLTLFIWLVLLNDLLGVGEGHLLPLLLHQEFHQISGIHEARGFGVLPVDDVNLLPMGQQIVKMLNLRSGEVSRF